MSQENNDSRITLELKLKATKEQKAAIDQGIRTTRFYRNKGIAFWKNSYKEGVSINKTKLYTIINKGVFTGPEYDWSPENLNSSARQAAIERAWASISSFYRRCRQGAGEKGYPKFLRDSKSIEYKVSGWKLSKDRRSITFTDKLNIGTMELQGTYNLNHYWESSIKRVRIVRRADGYYVQFVIAGVSRVLLRNQTHQITAIDVGLENFYTTDKGETVKCPKFLRQQEKKIKRLHRWLSRTTKKSKNRQKAKKQLSLAYLKVSRQRKNFAIKLARALATSNDVVVYEDLNIAKMVENSRLAKSAYDASWRTFLQWLQYYDGISTFRALEEKCAYSSWECSGCSNLKKKGLSERWHHCQHCGLSLHRDHNAAKVMLQRGIRKLRQQNEQVPQGLRDSWVESSNKTLHPKTPLDLEPLLLVAAVPSVESSSDELGIPRLSREEQSIKSSMI